MECGDAVNRVSKSLCSAIINISSDNIFFFGYLDSNVEFFLELKNKLKFKSCWCSAVAQNNIKYLLKTRMLLPKTTINSLCNGQWTCQPNLNMCLSTFFLRGEDIIFWTFSPFHLKIIKIISFHFIMHAFILTAGFTIQGGRGGPYWRGVSLSFRGLPTPPPYECPPIWTQSSPTPTLA